jgi:hypothetical protein
MFGNLRSRGNVGEALFGCKEARHFGTDEEDSHERLLTSASWRTQNRT